MRVQNAASWQIAADFPEELQYAGYIAQQVGFRLEGAGAAQSQVEMEWRAWWDGLINSRLAVINALNHLIDPRPFREYDPLDFNFQVDFVLWPDAYHNPVSPHQVVLGAQFIQPQYAQELIAILKAMICALV